MTVRPPRLSPSSWSLLRERAREIGFDEVGLAPVKALGEARAASRPGAPASTGLPEWLAEGREGQMAYMRRTRRQREDPAAWWPEARSVVAVLVCHDGPGEPGDPDSSEEGPRGRVSRYAWGRDYHLVVGRMLRRLGRALEEEVPGARWRTSVDHGPTMEKPIAHLAGLGWIGKHGNLLRTDRSSWFFLGLLFTDAESESSPSSPTDHCGTCTACIEACPTGAIVEPAVVDARRCISYLTIELRRAVPESLRAGQGDWVFGCDACQDACPWNRHRTRAGSPRFSPGPLGRGPLLRDLLRLDQASFAARTPKSAVKRARREGLVRSAAIAAGNAGDTALVPDVAAVLARDPAAPTRSHAAWALGRLGGPSAREALERACGDPDGRVVAEARAALDSG